SPVGRYPGKVVMPLGVDPEAVVGYPVPLVTALVQGLQVTQDICVSDHVSLATAQDDRGTVPVQQLVDQNAHTLVTTDPTAWLLALEVGPQGFSRPGHRAHQKVVAAQRLHAECSAHAQDRQWAGRNTAVARRDPVTA